MENIELNTLFQLDYEMVDYVASLREGILEAYTGIVTGFKRTDKGSCFFSEQESASLTPYIFQFKLYYHTSPLFLSLSNAVSLMKIVKSLSCECRLV